MRIKKYLIGFILLACLFERGRAQSTLKIMVVDSDEKESLPGAAISVKGTTIAASADRDGKAILYNVPDGRQIIEYNLTGFKTRVDTFLFPIKKDDFIPVYLTEADEELEEIEVSSTRSSRSIYDIPTRIEIIAAEELEEKGADQPGNIKMILTESTGIQTQQTSATSANASIRIQGLDGKYTQLLKDGFPLYSGFSGGLSIMQVPPIDLKRVEVIKGSASTLYGGGAIAGLINLITKDPAEKRELTFMVNGTSAKGFDLNGYYNQKFKKVGITFLASQNLQKPYDPNKDGLSDIPMYKRYTLNPRIFYYIDSTATLSLGLNTTVENRLGGDMQVINNRADSVHTFYERNISNRNSSQLKFEKCFANKSVLTAKNSVSDFSRTISLPGYEFAGQQTASYSEISFLLPRTRTEWVTGMNVWTDRFKENNDSSIIKRDYNLVTVGIFSQNHWNINSRLLAEMGMRLDYINLDAPNQSGKSNFFLLPRLSLLYKITNGLTTRLSGGSGYKAPVIFSETAEAEGFDNIAPVNIQKSQNETSIGGNFDLNYRTTIFEQCLFTLNEMLFYTHLNNPLILNYNGTDNINEFSNANGFLLTQGSETNIKFKYEDIGIYIGYTYTDAQRHFNNLSQTNPLTAKHRLNLMAMYEVENKMRIGYEAFYVSSQTLSNGKTTPDYWIMGVSAEKKFKHFSVFINAENYMDTRQSRYQPMYTGTIQNPQFSEIWAPTDGFIFNGGFKIML